ncbi:Benzoyl-CoA reductase subunit BadG [Methanosarcina barkeri 3]|uniref:Benzoyl-CoA reductase subunit BadG n=1 Tax=Methanosarcina barkeri 3 TaxID=1434107 RepID=A0A0E3WZ15_METBA|nr:acyl-CoA dehydratase activase [Methanosarcina barkeri]AKB82984.1 Benzoyl-CoA reductase subunit BadG [Methanosarcina barkeri 3]
MIGFDVGSRTAKLVRFDDDNISDYKIINSMNWEKLFDTLNLKDVSSVCTTGYFRKSIPNSWNITEITASIFGAKYYYPKADVIVDIGGQDTKVIDIRNNSFKLNDKCSAGTGAFLEFVAKYFDLEVEELEKLHKESEKPITLNQTCGIFALSEMISQVVNHEKIENVISGMHYSFAHRISHMVPECRSVVLVGGVVKNKGIVDALSNILNCEILIPPDPQIINALGAARYAQQLRSKS